MIPLDPLANTRPDVCRKGNAGALYQYSGSSGADTQSNAMLMFVATTGARLGSTRSIRKVCTHREANLIRISSTKPCRQAVVCTSLPETKGSARAIYENGASGPRVVANEFERYPIQLMACDIDGTILNHAVQITQQNIAAVKRLLSETKVLFIPATGKSRCGALRSMGTLGERLKRMYPNGCPGVFLQGLIVFGMEGEVVYENKCSPSLANSVIQLSRELELDLIAYSRDGILCERRSELLDLLPTYHEPLPEEIEDWKSVIGSRPLNKFIFMAEPDEIDRVRPFVAGRIGNTGVLTQAQGNMLEVLPPNSSKGNGVTRLLQSIGIVPENVLAIGDAENDLEMLSMVRYSCAVANALPSVKAVARYTDIRSNDDSGVAHAIERFILSRVEASA